MPGRAALTNTGGVLSDMRSIKTGNNTGVSGSDQSEIGGEGRKGGDANGQLTAAPECRIDHKFKESGGHGMAQGGLYPEGKGRTF